MIEWFKRAFCIGYSCFCLSVYTRSILSVALIISIIKLWMQFQNLNFMHKITRAHNHNENGIEGIINFYANEFIFSIRIYVLWNMPINSDGKSVRLFQYVQSKTRRGTAYWPCEVKWWKVLKNIRLLRSEVNVKPKKRNFRSISDFLNYDFLNIVKAKLFVCSGTFYTIPQRY